MTMHRWILTTAMAFSSLSLACDSGNEDESSDASGNNDASSGGADEDGEESGEDSTSSSSSTTTEGGETNDGDIDYATQIQPIWDDNCMGASCHEGLFPPNLTQGMSYAEIVDVQAPMGMKTFVVPGDADASYLFHKLLGSDDIAGDRMPWLLPPLPESDMALIEDWINAGAPE